MAFVFSIPCTAISVFATYLIAKHQEIIRLQDQIAEPRDQRADRNAQIDSLTKQLNNRDAQIESLTKQLSDRDAEIDSLNKQLSDHDTQIDSLNKQLSNHDPQIKFLTKRSTKRLNDRDAQIKSLNKQLSDCNAKIVFLTKWEIPVPEGYQRCHITGIPISNQRLQQLKAMPYQQYLRTYEWKARRDEMLKRAGYRCQVTNRSDNLNVHHRTYDRLGNEAPEDLTVLCRECHLLVHEQMGMPVIQS